MKNLLVPFVLLHALLLAESNFARGADQALVDRQIESIRQEYGVHVHYRYDPAVYFPKAWLEKPRSAKASQLDLDEVERIIPVTDRFLQRNPKAVIQRNLSDIYLSATLEFFGIGIPSQIQPTLGNLIGDAQVGSLTNGLGWWTLVTPAGLLVLILVCVNLLGDGLAEALRPARPR